MKQFYNVLAAVSVALSVVSCEHPDYAICHDGNEIVLTAEWADASPSTKNVITDDTQNPLPLSWLAGDAINVFFGNSKSSIFTTAVSGRIAEFTGSINGVVGGVEGATQENFLWGVYPYSSKTTCDGSSVIYTLPSVQTAVAGTFADDLYPAIARSQNFYMSFYNVCGGFRFKVSNPDIVKVTLKGNKGESLAGKAKITMDEYPVVEEILEGSTELTMTAPDGGCFEVGKYYYFVAYPREFSEGLTITYHKEDSQADYVVSKAYTLPRSKFSSFTNRDAGLTFVKTDAVHYIDEYGVNHGPGVEIDGVVWAPVNCGYHETDYPYGKLYQWGRKYGQGYSGDSYDINGNELDLVHDATVPKTGEGNISIIGGNLEKNQNVYYFSHSKDWAYPSNDKAWNAGTEDIPIKTIYDPCPDGWRVPTRSELMVFENTSSVFTTNSDMQPGYYFEEKKSNEGYQLFLPFSGYAVSAFGGYCATGRGGEGFYWCSSPDVDSCAFCLDLYDCGCHENSGYRNNAFSIRCVYDINAFNVEGQNPEEVIYIPVSALNLVSSSIRVLEGDIINLDAEVLPIDATEEIRWGSTAPSVAMVDQKGILIGKTEGKAIITATAGDVSATCSVVVSKPSRYIDEYGKDHGTGTAVGNAIWAPVNCGYHEIDFPYGKLYQWGRKYGQGYSGKLYDLSRNEIGTISDAIIPTIEYSSVSVAEGQLIENANIFYCGETYYSGWLNISDYTLWNAGTEESPIKTENDPCPRGWRVPTHSEVSSLIMHKSSPMSDTNGKNGYWLSGELICSSDNPMIFLPFVGRRISHTCYSRGHVDGCHYWSSSSCVYSFPDVINISKGVDFYTGKAVRCVLE